MFYERYIDLCNRAGISPSAAATKAGFSCGAKQVPERRKALKRANGTGTVYKLSGRRRRPWVAAKSKVVIGYYETKTAALEALNRLAGRDITERYNMTFEDVFHEWSAEHYRDITSAGIETYDRAFAIFKPLHKKLFRSLKTADFQAVVDQHMTKSHSTVAKYILLNVAIASDEHDKIRTIYDALQSIMRELINEED